MTVVTDSKRIDAISLRDYLRFGCPNCGGLPTACLSPEWTMLCDDGDIGDCPSCGSTFIVLPDGSEEGRPAVESFRLELAIGRGYSFRPKLGPHPRHGILYNECSSEATDHELLDHGTIYGSTSTRQLQTSAT